MYTPDSIEEPRSYLGTAIMVAAFTAFPFGLVMSGFMWLIAPSFPALAIASGMGSGGLFGLAMGFILAFKLRALTERIALEDVPGVQNALAIKLAQLGFYPESQFESVWTYRPSIQAGLAAGRITLVWEPHGVTVVGPEVYVKRLLMHMRGSNLMGLADGRIPPRFESG